MDKYLKERSETESSPLVSLSKYSCRQLSLVKVLSKKRQGGVIENRESVIITSLEHSIWMQTMNRSTHVIIAVQSK